MKLPIVQKIYIILLAIVAAVALCVLPFFAIDKETIYVYTANIYPDSREQGFVNALKRIGYKVKLNNKSSPAPDSIGFWFTPPKYLAKINQSQAKYNLIYSEGYYPLDSQEVQTNLIILTPYQDLYEHYVRSNIKSAKFVLGVNLEDFSVNSKNFLKGYKKYPLIYYGGDTLSPLAEKLRQEKNVKFLVQKGEIGANILPIKEGDVTERGDFLSKASIVALYNYENSPQRKYIQPELMEAAASGALVVSTPNSAVEEIYGDSIVMYRNLEEFPKQINYYLTHQEIMRNKIIKAHKITAEKLSSEASARRIHELIEWLNRTKRNGD